MTPSIDAAKKLAKILDTTVGYLLGETDKANLFKDPVMLQWLRELDKMKNKKTYTARTGWVYVFVKLKNIGALQIHKPLKLSDLCI